MDFQLEEEAFEYFGGEELQAPAVPLWTAGKAKVDARGKAWVKWLQTSLNQLTGAKGSTDGKWGSGTVGWLKTFQKAAGLTPDGLVSAATLKAMLAAGAPAAPAWAAEEVGYAKATTLPKGQPGDNIRCTVGGVSVPRIDGVVSLNSVSGLHFEYVALKPPVKNATGLLAFKPEDRTMLRTQSFVGDVKTRLERLFASFAEVGLNIEAVLTAGSFVQRCISNTNRLSDHSFAGAFDLVGVRWVGTSPSGSGLRETIVHNFNQPSELKVLMRINALLRRQFPQVLDYNYNKGHQDHFHMDLDKPHSLSIKRWVHHALEALTHGVRARAAPHTAGLGTGKAFYGLLAGYLGAPGAKPADLDKQLPAVFHRVTEQIAKGQF